MSIPAIVFFTGASGAGKSSIVKGLSQRFTNDAGVQSLYFDSIGVPKLEEMIRNYGSGKEWQKQKTDEWIDRMIKKYQSKRLILFEGQTEIKFIIDAFQKQHFVNYRVVLIHAHDADRHLRLRNLRKQPELINDEMDNWARFLLKQAIEYNVSIIDTSIHNLDTIIMSLYEWLQNPDFVTDKNAACFTQPKDWPKEFI